MNQRKNIEIFRPCIYQVESESVRDKEYLVTNYRPNRFTCTCKDYVYRSHGTDGYTTRHRCKHIKKIIQELEIINKLLEGVMDE